MIEVFLASLFNYFGRRKTRLGLGLRLRGLTQEKRALYLDLAIVLLEYKRFWPESHVLDSLSAEQRRPGNWRIPEEPHPLISIKHAIAIPAPYIEIAVRSQHAR